MSDSAATERRAAGLPAHGPSSDAQTALARMLEAAFDEPELAERCITAALLDAGRDDVPADTEELLAFGREHLVPILAEELGPRIVSMLFEDLVSDLARLRRSDIRLTDPTPRALGALGPLTLPPLRDFEQRPHTPAPTMHSPAPRESLPAIRAVVAIIESDRWVRAPIARGLVQAGYDVLPLDSATSLLDLFRDGEASERIDVVVTEVTSPEDAAVLRELRLRRPNARVVAWTRATSELAAGRVAQSGIASFSVVPRNVAAARVVEAARRLL